jgi:hypothetical protein
MALEITVGPPQLAINEGNVVLVTDPDGQIVFPSDKRRIFFRYTSDQKLEYLGQRRALGSPQQRKHYALRLTDIPNQWGDPDRARRSRPCGRAR